MTFTHLHVHSHYSILDGMSKIPDLVDKAMRDGVYSLALTDHGNMYGIKDFMDYVGKVNAKTNSKIEDQDKILKNEEATDEEKANAKQEIEKLKRSIFKPIIGIEAYCARRTLYDQDKDVKEFSVERGRERIVDRSGWHLIILAKNREGYHNLCKLSSIGFTKGFYDSPRIDKNVLKEYHEGLIVSSACLGGEVSQHIIEGKIDEA